MTDDVFAWADKPLLILTCIDPRVTAALPTDAFVIRTAGASLDPVEVDASVAVAVKGARSIAVITHTDCAMRAPDAGEVAKQLSAEGWDGDAAERFAAAAIPPRAIGDERDAARRTARALAERFPTTVVRAFCFRVEDASLEPLSPKV